MNEQRYRLSTQHSWMVLSPDDIALLELNDGDSIDEPALRRRLRRVDNPSLVQALHAMLDEEEAGVTITINLLD